MKTLFLQTKNCEVSQIRINLNSLGLVVNKHCQRLKHTTKLGDANKLAFYFKIQFQYSRCGFRQFHRKQSTSFTCHIIDENAVAVPNQVVGGRVSLLNKGNFCHPPRFFTPTQNLGNYRVLWHLASSHFVSTFVSDGIMAHPMHQNLAQLESWPALDWPPTVQLLESKRK